jgi:hypothetical protein
MIRIALAAALTGSVLGTAAVLASDDAPPKVPAITARATSTPEPAQQPTMPERNSRIIRRVDDPAGGAPWAIRAWDSSYRTRRTKEIRHTTCLQVGRLQGDAFGWVDAEGRFMAKQGAGGMCQTAKQLKASGAFSHRINLVASDGKPGETVTWGRAEADVTRLTLNDEPPFDPDGAFIRVAPAAAPVIVKSTIEYDDGTRRVVDPLGSYPGERSLPGSQRLAAFAPDPAGGAPWGLMALKGERGSTCIGTPGKLVGNHLGEIDARYDILMADPFENFGQCGRKPPTRAYPLRLDALIGGRQGDDQGRIERRVLEGRIVYFGTVHPDVASVTIVTPRDVRSLVPSKDFPAIVTVYAGLFPGGTATAIAHFKDGRTVARSLHVE